MVIRITDNRYSYLLSVIRITILVASKMLIVHFFFCTAVFTQELKRCAKRQREKLIGANEI